MRAYFAALLASLIATAARAAESPIPGYRIVPIQWEIEVAPGQIARLNGTVQEVYAQALQINPNFKLKTPSTPARPRRALAHQRSKVEDCNYPYPLAEASKIHDGVEYLRGVPGKPVEGPGPTACGRVSCSWKSAIWWCNDNKNLYTLDSFNKIADSAQFILLTCPWTGYMNWYVSGQNFETEHWSTIVKGDDC
ncbi:fd896ae8-f71e-4e42-ba99-548a03bad6f5 [Thermothielavioides terrestris]|uniref:Uncharacterized protein n=2 Tax=Thermothielavioides terrestris TaxID=2587410 RepID=G2RB76_THETT|nr:uncharacterized protein THITE_2146087 [Thermothielavioides terrestris NRRL 8126]AEO69047.1 hypothetical protein THITE_2146087 [Thermothielavioides terrestris NRRL 8126]SPQ22676.1 fd896ae8-f71e-4e42-ba99-548a03bad6f5 [Thermothielavioides terrestris]